METFVRDDIPPQFIISLSLYPPTSLSQLLGQLQENGDISYKRMSVITEKLTGPPGSFPGARRNPKVLMRTTHLQNDSTENCQNFWVDKFTRSGWFHLRRAQLVNRNFIHYLS